MVDDGKYPTIGDTYGISAATVGDIKCGRQWKHLTQGIFEVRGVRSPKGGNQHDRKESAACVMMRKIFSSSSGPIRWHTKGDTKPDTVLEDAWVCTA
jgi:hypothetical protein